MGRSPSFCFSIKACTGKADEGDFSTLQEVKASPEKRRWSFRKKDAGHHVPINTVISESLPIFAENQNQEANSGTFYSEKAPSNSEKVSLVEQTSPTLQLPSALVSSRVPKESSNTSTVLADFNIPEHIVIVIQTSIRRYLARSELQKHKYVVKLQAAARGYLVRRQAAGTLRCIQAIVKLQAVIRARHSVVNLDERIQADVMKQSNAKLNKTPSAIMKLVSSTFARQLLESAPKAKSIRISCDPMRPESAWNWLERWMALTSIDQQKFVLNQEKDMKNDLAAYDVGVESNVISQHASSVSELSGNSPQVPEVKGDLRTKSSWSTELSATAFVSDQILISSVQDNELLSRVQETLAMENNEDWSNREAKEVSNYISSQRQHPLDASLLVELDGNLHNPDYTKDKVKNGARNALIGADENEGGKVLNGSRKSKNPAFAAVQAKFEELSSASDSNRYFDYASTDVIVSTSAHSQVDFISKEVKERKSVHSKVVKEPTLNEKLSSHSPKGEGAASWHGIEISVSSRNRPDDSVAEIVPEHRTSVEINHGLVSVANDSLKFDEIKTETKKYFSKLPISTSSVEATKVEEDAEDTYVDKPSPYGSPRSHTAAEYSPTAPSSQISLHVRTDKTEDNINAKKKKSQLAVKNSPTQLNNDSDARSSAEHLPKGTKIVKRPNSSGSDRTKHVDQEDRNSGNSLPGYMQLTESAKAKINTSFSHHKEKRHSFPIGNEKPGLSPRMRSPKSHSPRYLKGSDVSSDNATGEPLSFVFIFSFLLSLPALKTRFNFGAYISFNEKNWVGTGLIYAGFALR